MGKEEIIRFELRLPEKVINYLKEYQIRHKIEGSLQKVAEIAMMRELTGDAISKDDKELINKVSKIKTILELFNHIHTMTPDNLTVRELDAIRTSCNFLIEFGGYVNPPIIDECEEMLDPLVRQRRLVKYYNSRKS